MRVLSDFDGVLTTQEEESDAVGARQLERCTEALGSGDRAINLINRAKGIVLSAPSKHGWIIKGHLTCFADEDPYVFHNAVANVLFDLKDKALLEGMKSQGFDNASDFASACFAEGTEAWRQANDSHMVPEVTPLLKTLAKAGADVVIVSNSSTARVESIFDDFGSHNIQGTRPRIRGGAMKFVVTDDIPVPVPEVATFGPRDIKLRRGHYYGILEEERPDLVIGDVLSLDLALPVTLRDTRPGFEEMKICFKRADHTPDWALKAAEARGIHIVDSVIEILPLLGL